MILGFDIGNTSTLMGVYRSDGILPEKTFRFTTEKSLTSARLAGIIRENLDLAMRDNPGMTGISGMIYSSVVKEVNRAYHETGRELCGRDPLAVNAAMDLSITIQYRNPSELGADRIVNGEAAYREYGGDILVVDVGTAMTFCIIETGGLFKGGIIAPGVGIMLDSVSRRTSQLPKVTFQKPDSIIADNTHDAVTSGVFYGVVSMLEGIIARIEGYYGKAFRKIITGGYAEMIADQAGRNDLIVDGGLTMKGLKYIYDKNSIL